ncbi:FAD-binding protein [Dehalococcoidia bacterium]|nr:FAD-binding protein [Dehalococcoidia bacterium]
MKLNDVQSQLNESDVLAVRRPENLDDATNIVREASLAKTPMSIAGARHSMGGQQFASGALCIDTTSLDNVIALNPDTQTVEVEAGITWPKLVAWLQANQDDNGLTIIQKQTGADELTLGGALSSNVHGRGLNYQPIVQDIESFTLCDASGTVKTCSRDENADLFHLAIGGYGLFGLIQTVTLRLRPRQKLMRSVTLTDTNQAIGILEERATEGHIYGDFQYVTDESSPDFLQQGVLSTYKPVANSTPIATNQLGFSTEDWMNLYYLAHMNKPAARQLYSEHYLQTDGQIYWSDDHQFSPYLSNAGQMLHEKLGNQDYSSLMISELYVPRTEFVRFMATVREKIIGLDANVIYGTVRLIKGEQETFLRWATEDYACIIFNLQVLHTQAGIASAQEQFQLLIDQALAHQGSYYLTYHRWAHREQILSAYPQMPDFLAQKTKHDPNELFISDWYRHYKSLI